MFGSQRLVKTFEFLIARTQLPKHSGAGIFRKPSTWVLLKINESKNPNGPNSHGMIWVQETVVKIHIIIRTHTCIYVNIYPSIYLRNVSNGWVLLSVLKCSWLLLYVLRCSWYLDAVRSEKNQPTTQKIKTTVHLQDLHFRLQVCKSAGPNQRLIGKCSIVHQAPQWSNVKTMGSSSCWVPAGDFANAFTCWSNAVSGVRRTHTGYIFLGLSRQSSFLLT